MKNSSTATVILLISNLAVATTCLDEIVASGIVPAGNTVDGYHRVITESTDKGVLVTTTKGQYLVSDEKGCTLANTKTNFISTIKSWYQEKMSSRSELLEQRLEISKNLKELETQRSNLAGPDLQKLNDKIRVLQDERQELLKELDQTMIETRAAQSWLEKCSSPKESSSEMRDFANGTLVQLRDAKLGYPAQPAGPRGAK